MSRDRSAFGGRRSAFIGSGDVDMRRIEMSDLARGAFDEAGSEPNAKRRTPNHE